MNQQPPQKPPHERRFREYEDAHYHDEIEVVPPDDSAPKPVPRRKPVRKLLKRRHDEAG